MNPSYEEISELVNALQLSINSEIDGHSTSNDGVSIHFDTRKKNDPHLEIFTKLVPGSWNESGDSYFIKNLDDIDIPTLTSFLMLSRLNKESMNKLAEMDGRYRQLYALKRLGANSGKVETKITNLEDWTNFLKNQIQNKKLSFSQLSRLTGISQVTLHKLKDGSDIRLSTMLKICAALGISLELEAK